MTKKAHRRLAGLLEPRRRLKSRADAGDYGRHPLDSAQEELQPHLRRDVPADDPFMHPGHSELVQQLDRMIDDAMVRAGAISAEVDPLIQLSDAAGLTLAEYEAVAMTIEGAGIPEIAKAQRVSETAARGAVRRGRLKLRSAVRAADGTPLAMFGLHESAEAILDG